MYSTPTCHYCNLAKDFFNDYNISYEVFNVQTDLAKRKEMMEKSGQMGVPVIMVGEKVIVGFDKKTLEEELGIKG